MSVIQNELQHQIDTRPLFARLKTFDWIFALVVAGGVIYAWSDFSGLMDIYEIAILFGTGIAMVILGWSHKPMRLFMLIVAATSLIAISVYGDDLTRRESNFFLKYLLSGQSATMWMSALFVLATLTYFFGLFMRSEFSNKVATSMTWTAAAMGLIGLLVRWRESYLISSDVGHIPVSNLYEVFILFAVITSLIYLYYEARYKIRALGGFVLLVISAAVGFLLWYTFDRQANEIQPLVPALQSYWMKIHVPANFIGYGCFALAAMMGVTWLLRDYHDRNTANNFKDSVLSYLPEPVVIDEIMYKAISLGFAFFTLATVLGAVWAAEAWGGYWSWDPKETWALIVWLNYAAWLHMRLTKGWRGAPMAWWSVAGFFVTLFAFLGVNMFLSGLHSYGEL